jgi:FeS assembly SUF system protein
MDSLEEPYRLPQSLVSLPVIVPGSAHSDELRPEAQQPPPTPSYLEGGANAAHVNRMENSGLAALSQNPLEQRVVQALRSVYDPEIPVNIYDLGLVYDIEITPANEVNVKLTLTAPGCPVAGSLPGEVEQRIEQIPEVKNAKVELVWEPTWAREMMSEVARLELGMT